MKQCITHGCDEAATGYSNLCDKHKHIKRRHGHQGQLGVTVGDLAHYRKRIKERVLKNADNPVWGILRLRWEKALELTVEESGGVSIGYQKKALGELGKLGKNVGVAEVTEVILAMYLLQEEHPHSFRSDIAFDSQLVRRVRGLTETNAGVYWNQKLQRTRRVYRDLPPKTSAILADYLKTIFGGAAIHVARLEQAEAEKMRLAQEGFRNALAELT